MSVTPSLLKQVFTLPNLLTLSRVLVIPLVLFLLSSGWALLALSILVISLFTDFWDGHFARKLGQSSDLGALLDPVCDKIVVVAYFLIFYFYRPVLDLPVDLFFPLWFVLLTIARNISQLAAVPILSVWLKKPFKVKPKLFPKVATGFSFTAVGFLPVLVAWPIFAEEIDGVAKFVLGVGFSDSASYYSYEFFRLSFKWILIPISTIMELQILLTYWPRLFQIATDRHDTFE